MQLRADLALQSAIRSLTDVVLPAVDPANAPAQEQLKVVIGLLQLCAARAPLQFTYDRDELERLLEFARALREPHARDGAGATHALDAVIEAGVDVAARARATPAELLAALRALRAATASTVTARYAAGDRAARASLSTLVLAHAEAQLLRERAWLKPQGWEAAPEHLPEIEDLLERPRANSG